MSDGDEQLRSLRRSTSIGARQRLDCLLLEALVAPGMAQGQVRRIADLERSGELERAQRAMDEMSTKTGEGAP